MSATGYELPGSRTLATTRTADCAVALKRQGADYTITSCNRVLMTSADTASERALGRLTARLLCSTRAPRVLVGGLGMGFTLRALLDRLPADARVVVVELLPAVVRWNRRFLGKLSARASEDPRVRLRVGDVARALQGRPAWDAIVLDVDNGPEWLVQRRNQSLYGERGLARALASLRPGGFVALWSASPNPRFEQRLSALGLRSRRFQNLSEGVAGPALYVVPKSALHRPAVRRFETPESDASERRPVRNGL